MQDDRRAYIRYPHRLDILWQFLGLSPQDMISGQIVDVSLAGVAILTDRVFTPGTTLMVRLRLPTQGWISHLVRVKHSKPAENGQFQTGCSFVKPLRPDQLNSILR